MPTQIATIKCSGRLSVIKVKRKKKKFRVTLRKKTQDNSSSTSLKDYEEYAKQLRECHPFHIPGLIREWYEKCFNGEFPPWDEYGMNFCRMRVAYHLYYHDFIKEGKPVPKTVLKNYRATQEFNIDKLNNGVIKHMILAELKHKNTGEKPMARPKEKEVTPVQKKKATKEKAYQSWVRILEAAAKTKKNFTALELAKKMQEAQPGKKEYGEKDVRLHVGMYNRGDIKGQTAAPQLKCILADGKTPSAEPKTKVKKVKKVKESPAPTATKKKATKKKLVLKKKKRK